MSKETLIAMLTKAYRDDGILDKFEAFELINAITKEAKFQTKNFTGEAGEAYAHRYYGGELMPDGFKDYDILSNDRRIQVKCRGTKSKPSIDGIQYKNVFDLIAVVTFSNEGFTGIIEITHDEFFANASRRKDKAKPCWSWALPKHVLERDRIYV